MMHVMSAPPSSAAAGTPAASRAGRSGGDGDFASILAAQAQPAMGEPEAVADDGPGLPSAPAEEGEADGEHGVSPEAEPSTLLTIVTPAPVPADGAPPASAGGLSDGADGDPAGLVLEGAAATEHAADGTATTSSMLVSASTTATVSASEAASPQAPVPASDMPAHEATSTESDEARVTLRPTEARVRADGRADSTIVESDTAQKVRTAPRADGPSHPPQPGAPGAGWRAAAENAHAAVGPATGRTEQVDGARRRPSATEAPAARVAAPGQADMAVAASAASDVDGAAPAASRSAEGPQPLPSTVLDRVMRAVEALENAPPPKRVSFEVDGLRLTVSMRGDEVNVAVRGGGDQLGAGWQRDLDGALRGRGFGLSDGQGGDAERGDGRQHPDDRPPHRPAGRGHAFRQSAEPDGDASTNLHL